MFLHLLAVPERFRIAPLWLQSFMVLVILNITIFIVKSILVGVKFYYATQLGISFIILVLIIFVLFPRIAAHGASSLTINNIIYDLHALICLQSYKSLSFACYNFVKSKFTFFITVWAFGHMVYISAWALINWKCTMYVLITFDLAFVIFFAGLFAMYIQSERAEDELITVISTTPVVDISVKNAKISPVQAEQHPFHILPSSFWPFLTAYFTFDTLFFTVRYFHFGLTHYTRHHLFFSFVFLLIVLALWFWNIAEEANEGAHTKKVRWNLLHGMMLFIASEVMLFFAIFWAFFHSSLSPSVAIYCMWPPMGIATIFPFGLPFLNTVLLLSSGITLTYAHRTLLNSASSSITSQGLLATLCLGVVFTFVQGFEYAYSPFSINDSVYGSIFFFATGFHGLHVIIGSIMLIVSLIRNTIGDLFTSQHVGFTAAIWYWHFVDVVWIFLFLTLYWWGS